MLTKKKRLKPLFVAFVKLCRETGIDLVEVELDIPLEEQGPFDLIIQKVPDYLGKAVGKELGKDEALQMLQGIKLYAKDHPGVILLDPLEPVCNLLDRTRSYQVMKECAITSEKGIRAVVPNFVQIDVLDIKENLMKIEKAGVSFPMISKPVIADGSDVSHKMAVIFNKEGLKDLMPPCVIQQFVNHDARLFKVYVAGNHRYIVQRPSIKNFYNTGAKDRETIFFLSNEMSKSYSASYLHKLDEDDDEDGSVYPDDKLVSDLLDKLERKLNLTLFGIDLIVEKGTGHHLVVDINYFPGYDGVPSAPEKITKYVHELLDESFKREQLEVQRAF